MSVEALQKSSSPAVHLDAPASGQPQTLEDLLKLSCVKVKSHAPDIFCYCVTSDGNLWVHGEGEGVIEADSGLFSKGQAKVGPAALKTMRDTKSWIEF